MHADLPTHPTTGLRAIGVLPSGRPVWPVLGGSGEGEGGAGEGGQGGGDGGQNGAGAGDRTFNQADVDRIVQQRLAREREQYADYEDVKAKAAELDKLREAEKTDLEKLQGQYEELLGKNARTEQALRITRAAAKHGLSEEAAAFLHGETDAEVDAAAAKLAALTNPAGGAGGGTNNGDGQPPGGRRPDPSQGRGSSGEGATSMAAGRQRYRDRHTKTT
ncbi:DUF4355 domain-containing protein [Nocardiopsis sp. NPDC006139]|uniref:capsid assembly scaffolding protein Gp46 family protein n=1 Tax=Nocardiopsis sp. NPDC006139 TaxID=3154578 RepID=UPI0033AAFFB6